MSSAAIPYDDREAEILFAGILAGTGGLWALLEVRHSRTHNNSYDTAIIEHRIIAIELYKH
jgi:ferric-dicitrate binding protein FerR (iron transport regulator)